MAEEAINLLCEKLGVTMEYLIPRTISYLQTSKSIILTILSVFLVLSSIAIGLSLRAYYKENANEDVCLVVIIVASIALVAFLICWPISLYDTIIVFKEPELSAIKYIVSQLK